MPVRNPRPQYPVAAIRRRIEGRVVLRVAIATDGQVSNVEVADSSGFGILDNAATNALWRWRFNPATRGGQFVESTVLVPVRFRLN
jgi:protein TonB